MDELELVRKSKNGDSASFGLLYDRFADRIFRYVSLKTGSRQQAEDILQEVFVKCWQALPKFREEDGNFSAWLYKIAGNAVNDYFRKVYRSPQTTELEEGMELPSSGSAADEASAQSDLSLVREVMNLLPEQYRQVLELRFVQDFSIKETARILGKSQIAIRLIQHRALKRMRELSEKKYAVSY